MLSILRYLVFIFLSAASFAVAEDLPRFDVEAFAFPNENNGGIQDITLHAKYEHAGEQFELKINGYQIKVTGRTFSNEVCLVKHDLETNACFKIKPKDTFKITLTDYLSRLSIPALNANRIKCRILSEKLMIFFSHFLKTIPVSSTISSLKKDKNTYQRLQLALI